MSEDVDVTLKHLKAGAAKYLKRCLVAYSTQAKSFPTVSGGASEQRCRCAPHQTADTVKWFSNSQHKVVDPPQRENSYSCFERYIFNRH